MAYKTLSELNTLFHTAVTSITGYDPQLVRIAYQTNQQPSILSDQDVVYIYITPSDSPYDKQVETTHTVGSPVSGEIGTPMPAELGYTRTMSVLLMSFGPSNYDTADLLRVMFSTDITTKESLNAAGIYMVLQPSAPRRVPYPYNGQWFQRTDVELLFNLTTTRDRVDYSIESATINIYAEEGLIRTVDVEPSP